LVQCLSTCFFFEHKQMSYIEISKHGGAKKYTARIYNGRGGVRSVSFGQAGAQDYVTGAGPQRRDAYLARHQAREDWNNPNTAGFWSARLLWGLSTNIRKNASDIAAFLRIPVYFV